MKKENNPYLHDPEPFMTLPVHSELGNLPCYVESKYQPLGFVDKEGYMWVPVMVDGALKRQRWGSV